MTIIDKMKNVLFRQKNPQKKASFQICFGIASLLVFAFFFAACDDAGLGESIDTTAPIVSITSPESSAVIKDAFEIKGTCFDDKAVASVIVTITNTVSGEKIDTKAAAISGNEWTLAVNQPANGTFPLPDGTYSASAICYDAAGRQSGEASRVFEIDNTAPVFCITSPNSLNIDDPAAFGRSVKIKGEIADDHPISSMDIRVFKAAGGAVNEITGSMAKTSFSGFETAGGTEVKIAQYYPEDQVPQAGTEEYSLYQNYMAMYSGATVGDTVKFYIFPFLTDSAGNTSSNCYIQTQLKKLVSEACAVETTSDSLQTAQFKKMINGSYSLGELNVDTVKQILSGNYVQTSSDYKYWAHMTKDASIDGAALLAMSVNANNAPMYEFGGYGVSNGAFTEATPGGQISVKISAGLDGTLVKPSSLKVYLFECDDTLALLNGGDFNNLSTASFSSANGDFTVTDGSNNVSTLTESVATGTYTVTLPSSLIGGNRYRLKAVGVDDEGNELYSDTVYAFKVTISANAPSVDFDGQFFLKASAISKDTSEADCYKAVISIEDRVEKTMKSQGSYLQVTPVLYKDYYAAKTSLPQRPDYTGTPITINSDGIEEVNAADGLYKATVPLKVFDLAAHPASNYTIALKVMARNSVANSETTTFILWADNAVPSLAITTPSANGAKIFESDGNYSSADQKYTFRGNWSDEKGSGTYRLWQSTTETAAPTFAYDPAPDNGTADGSTIYYEKKAADSYIPLGKLTSGRDVSSYYTLSLTSSGSGTWTEVEGVSQTASQTNWNAPVDVAQSEGQKIYFVAMDAVGNVSAVQGRTGIVYDFAAPTVSLAGVPGSLTPISVKQYYTASDAANGTIDFTIKGSDTFKITSLDIVATFTKPDGTVKTLSANDESCGFTIVQSDSSDANNIIKTVKIAADAASGKGDGTWSIKAKAKDAAGRETESVLVTTMVDCVKPAFVNYSDATTIAFGNDKTGVINSWYKEQTLTVWGKVNEAASGLSTVYYWLKYPGRTGEEPTDLTVTNDGSVTISGTKGSAIEYKIMPDNFAQTVVGASETTNNMLFVQAVDQAGNKSDVVHYEIQEDQTPPTVSTAFYTYDGTTMTPAAGSVMTNGSNAMTLYGALDDALSGLSSLSFKIGGTSLASDKVTINYSASAWSTFVEYTAAEYNASCASAKSWKAVIDKSVLQSGDLNVTASDSAGNSSEQKAFTLVVDTEAPTITLTSPTTPLASDVTDSNPAAAINGRVTFKGTANDTNGLGSVALYYSTSNTASSTWTPFLDNPITDSSMYNWSVEKDITSRDSESSFTMLGYDSSYSGSAKPLFIKIVANDQAANVKEYIYKYSIDPDGDRPKITITNVALDGMTSTNKAWRTGSNDIYGSVYDDDGVQKFEYKSDDGSWTEVTLNGTSFTISGLADGPHTLLFRITDSNGTVFTSDSSPSYISPKLYGKNGAEASGAFESGDTQLYVTVDTNAPTTGDKHFNVFSKAANAYGSDVNSLPTLGGDRTKFKYTVYAQDTNGVKSVKLSINNTSVSKTQTTSTVDDAHSGWQKFELSDIDISALSSGTYTATIVVTDKAGLERTDTMQIAVDNTAPTININAPAQSNPPKKLLGSSATANGSVTEYDGGVYYAICPIGKSDSVTSLPSSFSSYYDVTAGSTTNLASSISIEAETSETTHYKYKQISDAGLSWTINFDGDFNASGTHAYTLNDYLVSYGITTADAITRTSSPFDHIIRFYIWIKAVDAVGNVTEESREVYVDPQGDRPEITFAYPEENGRSVGGTVKLNGEVIDNVNANPKEKDTVWLQIISNNVPGNGSYTYDSASTADPTAFTVTAADVNAWVGYQKDNSPIYSVYKMTDYVIGGQNNQRLTGNLPDGENPADYGILADFGGTNWSLSVNTAGEFDDDANTNQIAVKAYAYYKDKGKFSVPAYRVMTFDADAPEMSERYLRQYNGNNVSASRVYKDNIYIKGAWYITFVLSDSDKVNQIGFSSTSASAAEGAKSSVSSSSYCTNIPVEGKEAYSKVLVKYPLSTNLNVGKEYLYVYFEDAKTNSPGKGHYTFVVNHDNVAPALTTSGSGFNISADVCNNDGWYTLGSKATENSVNSSNQSGVERVVFYFLRSNTNKVFDPMIKKGADGNFTLTNANGVSNMEGLYWKKQSVTVSGASVTLSSSDANIHKGGIVKIAGVNYRISSVSGTNLTIDSEAENGTYDAYFALGNVVDNTVQEKAGSSFSRNWTDNYGYGYGSGSPAHDNDDGDLMIEKLVTTGTESVWEALINSKNIPDGPIEIHYTVYDKAGNYSTGSVTQKTDGSPAFVSNNAPRIANVTVGTDYNGNDTIDSGESLTWFETSKTSWDDALKTITIQGATEGSSYITAKGKTVITPEIIGGNGALYYYWSYPTSATEFASGYNTTVFMASDTGTNGSREDQSAKKSASITLQVGDLNKALAGNGKYTFKIYDSTEGTVGVADLTATVTSPTSQHADITLWMDNQVKDGTAPTGKIHRFYWKDIKNNSIYGSSAAEDARKLKGHIELEGDLPTATFNATSGVMDLDPKVSGKIVIRGSAFDAVRLDSLYMKMPGFTSLGFADFKQVASYDLSSGAWKDSDNESTPITMDANGWRFNVTSNKFTSSGHYVSWELELDTSKYNGGTTPAGSDVLLEFQAKDKGAPTCAPGDIYTSVDGTTKYAATAFSAQQPSSGDAASEISTVYATDAQAAAEKFYTSAAFAAADTSEGYQKAVYSKSDFATIGAASGTGSVKSYAITFVAPKYKVDIVPYITKVYTKLGAMKKNNWSMFNRTSSGAYPVYVYKNSTTSDSTMADGDKETVQIYGFNLNGVKHGATSLTAATERQDESSDYDCYLFEAGASLTGTGSQEVDFTVGGISTLNNKNNNDSVGTYAETTTAPAGDYDVYANYYNRLPNNINNN
ncbi:MAG: hypothetical protein K5917_02050, partial [Clostridiales bacterium]|nr:hypothetical protein [Clostridiales bacterium]